MRWFRKRPRLSAIDKSWWHWDGTQWQPPTDWLKEDDRWVPPRQAPTRATARDLVIALESPERADDAPLTAAALYRHLAGSR